MNSLKGRHVFVSGADGFIGSHLVESLVEQGAKVRALAQYNSFNDWGWLDTISCLEQVEVVTGDLRDPFCMDKFVEGIDVVFNLAALISIPYSYIAPASNAQTNIEGTVNLLEAAKRHKVKRFLHTSTSEVYGTARYVPIDEKHPLQPQSPYSASKIGSEMMAMSYFNSFEVPVTVVRPFNTYGPRQSARAVIPTIITQIAQGAKVIKVGSTTPTRDFNYVLDTCKGFIDIANCDKAIGETINIGSNYEISIGDTLNLIKKLMNKPEVDIVTDEQRLRPANSEVERLWCDNTKINSLTGFKPQYDIERGLKETINFFANEKVLSRYKSHIYNV